jgi:hypothetical protein
MNPTRCDDCIKKNRQKITLRLTDSFGGEKKLITTVVHNYNFGFKHNLRSFSRFGKGWLGGGEPQASFCPSPVRAPASVHKQTRAVMQQTNAWRTPGTCWHQTSNQGTYKLLLTSWRIVIISCSIRVGGSTNTSRMSPWRRLPSMRKLFYEKKRSAIKPSIIQLRNENERKEWEVNT